MKTGKNFCLQHFKNKIIYNFVKFVGTKKGMTTNFFTPLFCGGFWIRNPRSKNFNSRENTGWLGSIV